MDESGIVSRGDVDPPVEHEVEIVDRLVLLRRGDDLLAAVRSIALPSDEESRALRSPRRPIVLCRKQSTSPLAANRSYRFV